MEIEKNASKNVHKILVGNKSDMESERKVSKDLGKEFAAQYGMKFFETSAKNSINVNESFITMTKEIMKNASKKTTSAPKKDNVVVSSAPGGQTIKSGKGCC